MRSSAELYRRRLWTVVRHHRFARGRSTNCEEAASLSPSPRAKKSCDLSQQSKAAAPRGFFRRRLWTVVSITALRGTDRPTAKKRHPYPQVLPQRKAAISRSSPKRLRRALLPQGRDKTLRCQQMLFALVRRHFLPSSHHHGKARVFQEKGRVLVDEGPE